MQGVMVAVLQPIGDGKYIAIDRAVVLVGRSSDCDAIVTGSKKISRRHCCLVQVDEAYYVRDLGSMNGVWVNGSRIKREVRLKAGDRLGIGDVEYRFYPNARIEQRAAASVPVSQPTETTGPRSNGKPHSGDSVEKAAAAVDSDDSPIVDSSEIAPGKKLPDAELFEIVDDVIPLESDDDFLETNELETMNDPIIDDEDNDSGSGAALEKD